MRIEKGQLGAPHVQGDGATWKGLVTEGFDDYLQYCVSASMRRNQIVVGGGGKDEVAASTYCLLEKFVRKREVKIDGG